MMLRPTNSPPSRENVCVPVSGRPIDHSARTSAPRSLENASAAPGPVDRDAATDKRKLNAARRPAFVARRLDNAPTHAQQPYHHWRGGLRPRGSGELPVSRFAAAPASSKRPTYAARLPARVDAEGELELFVDQDRTRWNRVLVEEGLAGSRPRDCLTGTFEQMRRAMRASVLAAGHGNVPTNMRLATGRSWAQLHSRVRPGLGFKRIWTI